jgi:hypothetical protein
MGEGRVAIRRRLETAVIHRSISTHRRALLAGGVAVALVLTGGIAALSRSDVFTRTDAGGGAVSDEAASLQTARSTGRPVRIASLTSETTEVYALPNGKLRADISTGMQRFRRSGSWVPVDQNLKRADDGSVVAVAHPGDLWISGPQGAGEHDLAAIGVGDDRVAMRWPGALPAPVIEKNTATYVDVRPGVDLVVESTRQGFEQFLIVKNRAAVAQVTDITLAFAGPGAAAAKKDADGAITFTGRGGDESFRIPAPLMWDAKTVAGVPESRRPVRTALTSGGDRAELTLTPDPAWLRSPSTAFPVTIDPTLDPATTTFDTWVREKVTTDQNQEKDLQIGLFATTPPTLARSFLTWDTTVLSGKQITAATVSFWNFWSHTCTATSWEIWTTGTSTNSTRYTSQPAWDQREATSTATHGSTDCADAWSTIDGKNFFQRAAIANKTRAGMGVRATDETATAGFKQFRSREGDAPAEDPKASVTYNAWPTVTARTTVPATSCVTGSGRPLVNTLTPQLKATVTDADNTMSVAYEWWSVDTNTRIGGQTLTGVASGTATTVTVPAGALFDGERIKWRVQASDGVSGSSSWSSFCEMTTWLTVPPVSGCPGGAAASDFNGDRVADVAIGDPEATINGRAGAGAVTIRYGGTAAAQLVQQGVDGVGDSPEAGDKVGFSLATYDANRDGCSDLAVGAPGEAIGTAAESGAVMVLLGSPAGLGKGPVGLWFDQNTTGWGDAAEAGDWFGYSLAAGATAAGEPFLAVGAPGEDVGTGVDAGIVHYLRGTTNLTMWGGAGVPGAAENDDRLGWSLAATPYHLAVGSPGESIGTTTWAGSTTTFTHEVSGTALKLVQVLGDDVADTVDPITKDDTFGKAIAMTPYPAGGTGVSLLVVGVPGKEVGAIRDAGKVYRYLVTPTGWSLLGSATAPAPAEGDYFGEQVQLGGGTTAWSATGAPGVDRDGSADVGAVFTFPAAPASVTPTELVSGSSAQQVTGGYLGSSAQSLYVADPRAGSVTAYPWASVVAGDATASGGWTAGDGAGAFGTAVS